MNITGLRLPCTSLLILLWLGMQAQGGSQTFQPVSKIAAATSKSQPNQITKSETNRFQKKFPQLFSGFAIEIATSTFPMDRDAVLFKQFGNVYYEKLPEGGYSYLIMAKFSSTEAALEFVNNNIKPRVAKAKLIEYTDGIRKVIRD